MLFRKDQMKILILLSALVALLSGCGGTWVKPGATQQDFYRDSAQCEMQGGQACNQMQGLAGALCKQRVQRNCIRGKGWSEQKESQKQETQKTQEESAAASSIRHPKSPSYLWLKKPDQLIEIENNSAIEEWTKLGTASSRGYYVDLGSIIQTSDRAKIWSVITHNGGFIHKGMGLNITQTRWEFNCKEEEARSISTMLSTASMLKGGKLSSGGVIESLNDKSDWLGVPPRSFLKTILMLSCKGIK